MHLGNQYSYIQMHLPMYYISLKILQNSENQDTTPSEKYFGFFCSYVDWSYGFIYFENCTSNPTFIFIVIRDDFQNYDCLWNKDMQKQISVVLFAL